MDGFIPHLSLYLSDNNLTSGPTLRSVETFRQDMSEELEASDQNTDIEAVDLDSDPLDHDGLFRSLEHSNESKSRDRENVEEGVELLIDDDDHRVDIIPVIGLIKKEEM